MSFKFTPGFAIRVLVLCVPCLSVVTHAATPAHAEAIDLSRATVILPTDADGPERAAAQLLVEEVARRTGLDWPVRPGANGRTSGDCRGCIALGRVDQVRQAGTTWPASAQKPEAFEVAASASAPILISGRDDRGVLFGVGYLLRHLEMAPHRAVLPGPIQVFSAPQLAVRGHQLGYRFKNNTYDAWTPEQFEQYIRDLAIFGSNTIEILPPITDDAASSPLFHLPAMEMMTRISGIVKKYGLRCSVYYPAMARDYSDPATAESELRSWGEVFEKLPQVDELFVPGGDPGHTDPAVLFPFLERAAQVLHRYHPEAGVWVSSQGFNAAQMERFYALVNAHPFWLTGVVVGPQSRDSLETQRARISRNIPIRFYPDIAHTTHAQFSLMSWDEAYALTEGREVIGPRPAAETAIFRHYAPSMNGFVTYSEGVNDDVNKFIWTALGWSGQADPGETLEEYARFFAGSDGVTAQAFARGIASLESNWNGPLASNDSVYATMQSFEQMEKAASPAQAANWRFEEALYRAYTDAYERHRLIAETAREWRAMEVLAGAAASGSLRAMQEAEKALARDGEETAQLGPWRQEIEDLAGRLYHHIGIQLSVAKYGASAVDRGASLDTLDVSLNDRAWLEAQFATIRKLGTEPERLRELDRIVHWTDPGPGGFYDDLGDPSAEPHLVRGPGFPADPALFNSAQDGIGDHTPEQGWKLSELSYVGALYDCPLQLHYSGLDPLAEYKVRIVYAGEEYTLPITFVANDEYTIHGPRLRASNPELVEFPVPPAATHGGTLDLRWTRPPGLGGSGRGFQVAEVWLIRSGK